MSAFERKLWQEHELSKLSPVERAKARLKASVKRSMGRRSAQARQATDRMIDATRYGTPLVTSLYLGKAKVPTNLFCSYRLFENELEITIPVFIERWHEWPPNNTPGWSRLKRRHRRCI